MHVVASLSETVTVDLPTDRRVGEESLEQPWLRGMRLRLCPSPLAPASTLWAPELIVLKAVLVSTRPGEPLRLPASERRKESRQNTMRGRKNIQLLTWATSGTEQRALQKCDQSPSNVRILIKKITRSAYVKLMLTFSDTSFQQYAY